jgi:hypothetical protein
MGITDKAKDKLKDAAGGVRGAQSEDTEERQPNEARFEPEDVRRHKKPKDNLPQPEDSKPER